MKIEEYEDTVFKVGKNSKENWELLKENRNYMWFHLESFSSCYVICCDENPTSEMIIYGSELCKMNTKYKNHGKLKVIYTPLNNLKKGKVEGMVIIRNNGKVKNILV